MPRRHDDELTLATVADGICEERFKVALQKVLSSLADETLDPGAVRRWTLEIEFKTTNRRGAVHIAVKDKLKLPARKAWESEAYMEGSPETVMRLVGPIGEQLQIPGVN